MGKAELNTNSGNPVVMDIKIWNAKGIQIVLNKISNSESGGFDLKIEALRGILKYPGMWDELNITTFIGVFYKIVKKYNGDIDNNITMQSIWKKFEWVCAEQLMEGISISTEDKVKRVLECKEEYHHGGARGLSGVGAYSVK